MCAKQIDSSRFETHSNGLRVRSHIRFFFYLLFKLRVEHILNALNRMLLLLLHRRGRGRCRRCRCWRERTHWILLWLALNLFASCISFFCCCCCSASRSAFVLHRVRFMCAEQKRQDNILRWISWILNSVCSIEATRHATTKIMSAHVDNCKYSRTHTRRGENERTGKKAEEINK